MAANSCHGYLNGWGKVENSAAERNKMLFSRWQVLDGSIYLKRNVGTAVIFGPTLSLANMPQYVKGGKSRYLNLECESIHSHCKAYSHNSSIVIIISKIYNAFFCSVSHLKIENLLFTYCMSWNSLKQIPCYGLVETSHCNV